MPSSKDIDSTEKQNKDNMVRKGNNKYYRRRELLVSKKVFRRTICLYKGLEMNSWQPGYLVNTRGGLRLHVASLRTPHTSGSKRSWIPVDERWIEENQLGPWNWQAHVTVWTDRRHFDGLVKARSLGTCSCSPSWGWRRRHSAAAASCSVENRSVGSSQ